MSIALLRLAVLLAVGVAACGASGPPNIVFILTDDMDSYFTGASAPNLRPEAGLISCMACGAVPPFSCPRRAGRKPHVATRRPAPRAGGLAYAHSEEQDS